jgi:hypothetical protein
VLSIWARDTFTPTKGDEKTGESIREDEIRKMKEKKSNLWARNTKF